MRISFLKLSTVAMLCIAISAHAADKKGDSSYEAKRAVAIKQIDEFGERMKKVDPSYKEKEAKLIVAAQIIANNYTPDQWLDRIQFLYAVLSEIESKAASIDPEAILSKYYPEEAQRAPSDAMSISSDIRGKWVEERAGELQQQLDTNTIGTLEHAARMLAVAKIYFPYDKRFVTHRQYRLDLAIRLARGDIDNQRFESLWAMRRQEFMGDMAKEKAQIQQQQQTANDQAVAQQNAMDAQRRAAILSNVSRGVQNAVNSLRPPVTCMAIANVMTCR